MRVLKKIKEWGASPLGRTIRTIFWLIFVFVFWIGYGACQEAKRAARDSSFRSMVSALKKKQDVGPIKRFADRLDSGWTVADVNETRDIFQLLRNQYINLIDFGYDLNKAEDDELRIAGRQEEEGIVFAIWAKGNDGRFCSLDDLIFFTKAGYSSRDLFRIKYNIPRPKLPKGYIYPPHKWYEQSPFEFLDFLKTEAESACFMNYYSQYGWIQEADIPKLIELLDSTDPCASVTRSRSRSAVYKSTIGQEAAFMLNGFISDRYPPLSERSSLMRKDELLTWWKEHQDKNLL